MTLRSNILRLEFSVRNPEEYKNEDRIKARPYLPDVTSRSCIRYQVGLTPVVVGTKRLKLS